MTNSVAEFKISNEALGRAFQNAGQRLGETLLFKIPSSFKWTAKGRVPKPLLQLATTLLNGKVTRESARELIEQWIRRDAECEIADRMHHEAVLLAQLSPLLAEVLDEELWSSLITHLASYASLASELHPDSLPIAFLSGAVEIPIVLQAYHPALFQLQLFQSTMNSALASIEKSFDESGKPHARMLGTFPESLASWVRTYFALQLFEEDSEYPEEIELHLQRCAQNALILSRNNDSIACGNSVKPKGWKSLRETVVSLAGDPAVKRLLGLRQPKSVRRLRVISEHALPEMSFQSDWAECAVMRSSWNVNSQAIYVDHSQELKIEIDGRNGIVTTCVCEPRITINQIPAERLTQWRATCWFSDEDADYLELEAEYSLDTKIQRQIVLAREENVILFADAVLTEECNEVAYQCDIEIPDRCQFFESEEYHEGFVMGSEPEALVLPLELGEWKDGSVNNGLCRTESGFQYSIQDRRGAVYAPLMFSLSRDSGAEPYTWRSLTVAESLRTLSHREAVGYRVQLNDAHWMIYRSLVSAASRSVLGQNTTEEFLFGIVGSDGEFHQYVGVEGVSAE